MDVTANKSEASACGPITWIKSSFKVVVEAAGAWHAELAPGAWETAMMNRLEGCTLPRLWDALYQEKSLAASLELQGALYSPLGKARCSSPRSSPRMGEDPWKVHSGHLRGP